MSFTAMIAGLFSLMKAVPILKDTFDKIFEMWLDDKIKNLSDAQTEISMQRKTLMKAITNAKTDEERINFSVILTKLNSGKLPNS